MFDLLLQLGAKLDIRNRQGLTPLTLATKLARKDVSHNKEQNLPCSWGSLSRKSGQDCPYTWEGIVLNYKQNLNESWLYSYTAI